MPQLVVEEREQFELFCAYPAKIGEYGIQVFVVAPGSIFVEIGFIDGKGLAQPYFHARHYGVLLVVKHVKDVTSGVPFTQQFWRREQSPLRWHLLDGPYEAFRAGVQLIAEP